MLFRKRGQAPPVSHLSALATLGSLLEECGCAHRALRLYITEQHMGAEDRARFRAHQSAFTRSTLIHRSAVRFRAPPLSW